MEEYESKVPRTEGCTVVFRDSKWLGARKGQDIDAYYYDVLDGDGKVIASHVVHDSTGVYPPHARRIYLHE